MTIVKQYCLICSEARELRETGIPVQRDKIVRPLLCVTRAEIEAYLDSLNISYCMDITNKSTEYTRNKIRLELLPYIKENINKKADIIL